MVNTAQLTPWLLDLRSPQRRLVMATVMMPLRMNSSCWAAKLPCRRDRRLTNDRIE